MTQLIQNYRYTIEDLAGAVTETTLVRVDTPQLCEWWQFFNPNPWKDGEQNGNAIPTTGHNFLIPAVTVEQGNMLGLSVREAEMVFNYSFGVVLKEAVPVELVRSFLSQRGYSWSYWRTTGQLIIEAETGLADQGVQELLDLIVDSYNS